MADYAIGDIHACLDPLQRLLERLRFDPGSDRLWLTGDLVGRGPEPAATLRFIRQLGAAAESVLGNHDIHCLAVAAGQGRLRANDQLETLLQADDRDELLTWLRQRPLMVDLPDLPYALVHAGIPPQWSIDQALAHAAEAEAALRGDDYGAFFKHLYGNKPRRWDDGLEGWDRLRFIINAFTRMRFCTDDGGLEFAHNGPPEQAPDTLTPWYAATGNRLDPQRATLITGHWSRLGCRTGNGFIALDTGCLWGGQLTAVRIDTQPPVFSQLDCPTALLPG